jgi:hypothetical protein
MLNRSWIESWTFGFSEVIFRVTVPSLKWIWDSSSSSIYQGESLVEVWAVLDRSWCKLEVWISFSEVVLWVTVPSLLWIWDSSSSSINKSESLVEVWAVLDRSWGKFIV